MSRPMSGWPPSTMQLMPSLLAILSLLGHEVDVLHEERTRRRSAAGPACASTTATAWRPGSSPCATTGPRLVAGR